MFTLLRIIILFTDTACPYCQKLHSEIEKLLQADITVRFLPYTRGGSSRPGYRQLKPVCCAQDCSQAVTDAKNQCFDGVPAGDCAAASMFDRGHSTGNKIGKSGTPAKRVETWRDDRVYWVQRRRNTAGDFYWQFRGSAQARGIDAKLPNMKHEDPNTQSVDSGETGLL